MIPLYFLNGTTVFSRSSDLGASSFHHNNFTETTKTSTRPASTNQDSPFAEPLSVAYDDVEFLIRRRNKGPSATNYVRTPFRNGNTISATESGQQEIARRFQLGEIRNNSPFFLTSFYLSFYRLDFFFSPFYFSFFLFSLSFSFSVIFYFSRTFFYFGGKKFFEIFLFFFFFYTRASGDIGDMKDLF